MDNNHFKQLLFRQKNTEEKIHVIHKKKTQKAQTKVYSKTFPYKDCYQKARLHTWGMYVFY